MVTKTLMESINCTFEQRGNVFLDYYFSYRKERVGDLVHPICRRSDGGASD